MREILDKPLTRRSFLKASGMGAGALFLGKLMPEDWQAIKDALAQVNPTVAILQLGTCAGCQTSLAGFGTDMRDGYGGSSDPTFYDILNSIELVYHQLLTDKLEEDFLNLTHVDICVIEGIGGETVESTELLAHARDIADTVITTGDCACYGGIPGLNAQKGLLNLNPVDEYITVDMKVPGCPPQPEHIVYAITAGALGEPLISGDVCEVCTQDTPHVWELGVPGCKKKVGCQGHPADWHCSAERSTGGVAPCTDVLDNCLRCYDPVFPRTPFYDL